jgi:hypothetical protein
MEECERELISKSFLYVQFECENVLEFTCFCFMIFANFFFPVNYHKTGQKYYIFASKIMSVQLCDVNKKFKKFSQLYDL